MNKKTITIVVTILVAAIALVTYQIIKTRSANDSAAEMMRTVTDTEYGIGFSFEEGEDAFTLVEPPKDQSGVTKAYLMIPSKAYLDYQASDDVREAPAGMNIFILTMQEDASSTASSAPRADRMTRLKEWAVKNDTLTQFSVAKATPEEVEIDGVKALKYESDGLYQQTIYLALYKDYIYMFVSQFDGDTDSTKTAFPALMDSVSFD